MDVPFPDPDLELYVGRASYYWNSNQVTGYWVTNKDKVVEASPLSLKLRTQAAGLTVLTKTCQLPKKKTINMYTDFLFAFGVYHTTGQLQKQVYNF